jgi:hypothetical protein
VAASTTKDQKQESIIVIRQQIVEAFGAEAFNAFSNSGFSLEGFSPAMESGHSVGSVIERPPAGAARRHRLTGCRPSRVRMLWS